MIKWKKASAADLGDWPQYRVVTIVKAHRRPNFLGSWPCTNHYSKSVPACSEVVCLRCYFEPASRPTVVSIKLANKVSDRTTART
eukprot:scaffold143401_cov27-Prasinocladus_malaysianus.AAC.1